MVTDYQRGDHTFESNSNNQATNDCIEDFDTAYSGTNKLCFKEAKIDCSIFQQYLLSVLGGVQNVL